MIVLTMITPLGSANIFNSLAPYPSGPSNMGKNGFCDPTASSAMKCVFCAHLTMAIRFNWQVGTDIVRPPSRQAGLQILSTGQKQGKPLSDMAMLTLLGRALPGNFHPMAV
ncbi:hypothetical protein [Zhengella sedimenti]|uniref:hypothetical protein n=1 Tax=Zhengella sedimenti TaxID=3390035 RepID=UPI00397706E1